MTEPNPDNAHGGPPPTKSRLGRWVIGVVGAGLVAAAVGFGNNLGNSGAERLTSTAPVSFSVAEQDGECTGATFLPGPLAERVRSQSPPQDWVAFQRQAEAAAVGGNVVQVVAQGTGEKVVTLTGIRFSVERENVPAGASFSSPCGGPSTGRALVVDLDASPARIISTNSDPELPVGSRPIGRHKRGITFPWTVSVTDPLLLYVVAETRDHLCSWTAEIDWVAGSERGTLMIDDDGRPFRSVGVRPGTTQWLASGPTKWTRLRR